MEFYIYIRRNPLGLFITIYDRDVIEDNEHFKNKKVTRLINENEVRRYMHEAVSIILYGDKAVELGIKENFIHPEAVATQYGVKVAIFIETRRL